MLRFPTASLLFAILAGSPAAVRAESADGAWPNGPSTSPAYFPVGVWLQNPAHAQRYRQIGVNLYVGLWKGPTPEQLAALRAARMQAIVAQNPVGLADKSGTIVAWMQDDEPDNAQPNGRGGYGAPVPPAEIIEKYHRMKQADPTRPVWLNLGRGVAWDGWHGRGPRTNRPEDYPEYVKGADIVSFDIYPGASREFAVKNQFWRVPYGVDRLRSWTRPGVPVWAFIETGNISGNGAATPEQVRATTWAALAHGARGIVYFMHQFAPTFTDRRLLNDPEMMASVAATNAMIHDLAPALNAPTVEGRVRVTSSDPTIALHFMRKDRDGEIYLFASNIRDAPTDATFHVDGAAADAVAIVMGESRSIAVVNGAFADHLKPFDAHIYRLKAAP